VSDDFANIERVLKGDMDAFEHLVQTYQHRLFHGVYQLVGDFQEAEDVAQEAFLKAFRSLHQFRRESGFYTWLFRIALNLVQSQRRKRKIPVRPSTDGIGLELNAVSVTPPVDARLMAADQAMMVRKALQAIPEEYREILILREIEDFDYEAIASLLEVPVGTVRSRLHRARLVLQQKLAERLMTENT
jgi:RNA polymerase sigma-70 factor, ECF subfamily